MALLDILRFPDPRLRKKALPVSTVTDQTRQLAQNMLETMYAAPGVGLAAIQVNVQQRVVVIDISEDKDDPLCLINPNILHKEGTEESEEGCLSVPEYYASIKRAEAIKVSALDREGKEFELEVDGLLAVCIQHELDHLNGKVFVDYLSPLKQKRLRKKIEKLSKQST